MPPLAVGKIMAEFLLDFCRCDRSYTRQQDVDLLRTWLTEENSGSGENE